MNNTPRVNQWWNAYRSGAITAADFKEAIQGMERELAQMRDELEKSEAADGHAPWVATADKPHPDKPGKKKYEIMPCLVVHKGEIELCAWNFEHGVWDDKDGDDFRYATVQVSHWMPLPSLPNKV